MLKRIISKIYFRRIDVYGTENIPETGPVVIACNHNSQFVDAMMLVLALNRPVSFIVAASSTKNPFLKWFLKLAKIIPTVRPIDHRKKGKGKIVDINDSVISGSGTTFTTEFKVGDFIRIYQIKYEFVVAEIIDDAHIKVKIPSELEDPKNDHDKNWKKRLYHREYDCMPKLDQSVVHKSAVDTLLKNEAIGIFPEGGSHDQTQLLPLKAGACLFLWSAQEKGINVPLVCVGVHYYGSHRFRSKAVINIGRVQELPLDVKRKDDKTYKYEYISNTLDKLKSGMEAVKINTSSYQKLLALNCAKEIFIDKETKMDKQLDFMLLQKFCAGFELIAHHEDSQLLIEKIEAFRKKIKQYGLRVSHLKNYDKFYKLSLLFMALKFLFAAVFVS